PLLHRWIEDHAPLSPWQRDLAFGLSFYEAHRLRFLRQGATPALPAAEDCLNSGQLRAATVVVSEHSYIAIRVKVDLPSVLAKLRDGQCLCPEDRRDQIAILVRNPRGMHRAY